MGDRYTTTKTSPSVRHLLTNPSDYLTRLCYRGHPHLDLPTTRTDLPVCGLCLAKLRRMNRQAALTQEDQPAIESPEGNDQ